MSGETIVPVGQSGGVLGKRALLLGTCFIAACCDRAVAAHRPKRASAPVNVQTSPADTPLGPVDVISRWAIILDYHTGTVMLSKNADDEVPPSSLTKLMTAFVVFGMLVSGRLRLDQTLPVSERAWRMQGSKMFVPLGGQVKVEDLIRGMVIQSGNDACIVLAEGISGSEDEFVVLMNDAARRIGLNHSVFKNSTGWPDEGHHMSVRDVATLAAAILRTYPQYYHFFSDKSYRFNNIDQGNRNVLVDKGLADGLKTGHTEAGGYALCASAERDGRRIIMVLNGMPTSQIRVEESERLLEWSFHSFEDAKIYGAGQAVDRAQVWLGEKATVDLVSAEDVVLTVPHGWQSAVKVVAHYSAPIAAPIRKGQPLGSLRIMGAGVEPLTLPLVAGEDVGRLLLPLRALAVVEHTVVGG